MKKLIIIIAILGLLCSCATVQPTKPIGNAKIINTGIYAKYGHILMFDDDGDRTPDYFEYYTCHPLFSNPSQLAIKQPDGDFIMGNHNCIKRGFADFR